MAHQSPSEPAPPFGRQTDCLIGLGSNLGNRQQALESAIDALRNHPRVSIVDVSRWYVTTAVGGPVNQESFLNGAALLRTSLSPHRLLEVLHEQEKRAGRRRTQRWAPRALDLDLLLYGAQIETERYGAVVPHPWMALRPFVLRPALDVASAMVHPELGLTIAQLWRLASRDLTLIAVLPPRSSKMAGQPESALQKIAERAGARFISLASHGVGLALDQRIQSMTDSANQIASAFGHTADRRAVVVQGWWDQSMLDIETGDPLPAVLIERRLELAAMVPLPNVTIGLIRPDTESNQQKSDTYQVSDFQRQFNNYLVQRPTKLAAPYLKISEDANRTAHDVIAILRGFAEIDIRPVG